MSFRHWCGIYYEVAASDLFRSAEDRWLPLISLSAHATICQNSSRLTLKQAFSNPSKEAISEAAYSFPIYENAAIVAFTCKIEKRIIRGVVRDKHTARKVYETAKEQGQQAALMIYNTPDVWSTRISNIPALGKVEVEITVVSELKHDAQVDGIRFTLPTSIAPRYGQAPCNLESSISGESRGIEITCSVTTTHPVRSLQSPSHPIEVGMGTHSIDGASPAAKDEFDLCKGYATLSQRDTALDKDFVLLIVSAGAGEPQAILETHPTIPNSRALLVSLVPKFNLPRIKPEIIFIADRSGSMGPQIPQLKNALTVFLKSLPVGVKFNICSFGSKYSFLWPKSMPYDQDNLRTALKHVESFQSDYGGTEMFPPIEAAFKNRYQDLETEILVLTDGEIWDMEPLFKLVQAQCESGAVRLFSLGIGDGVSHALVEGLARAGRGYAQIVGNQDKLDLKVVQMLKAALGAHVRDYHLVFPEDSHLMPEKSGQKDEAGEFEFVEHEEISRAGKTQKDLDKSGSEEKPKEKKTISLYDLTADTSPRISSEERFSHLPAFQPPSTLQIPYHIPALYTFSRTNVYTLLTDPGANPSSVILTGTTTSGLSLELEVPVKDIGQGTTVHQLAVRKLLKELEEGGSYLHSGKFGIDPKDEGKFMDWIEREAVRVGTTFGVAGKWTSFVAVEDVAELEQQIRQQEFDNEVSPQTEPASAQVSFFSLSAAPKELKSAPGFRRRGRPQFGPPFSFLDSVTSGAGLASAAPSSGFGSAVPFSSFCSAPAFGAALESSSADSAVPGSGFPSAAPTPQNLSFKARSRERARLTSLSAYAAQPGDGFSSALASVAPMRAPSSHEKTSDDLSLDTELDNLEIVGDAARKTYTLLRLQEFDGSFPKASGKWAADLTAAFKVWIQQEHGEWVASLRALSEEELNKLLASAAAITMFQKDLDESRGLWEMVVEKTDFWGVEKVGEGAWNAFKAWVDGQFVSASSLDKQRFWVKSPSTEN